MQFLALGLLLVGFAFKVSAVPFHMWTPDAYEAAPPAVTGFMSTGVKAAAFAAFARVFLSAFEPLRIEWAPVLWVVAAATMILGTVVGVAQSSVKRMLAYSSIAHARLSAGGAACRPTTSGKARCCSICSRTRVANLGAFGVIAALDNADRPNDQVRDYAGSGQRPSRACGADDDFPAVAWRLSADRRVRREVVRVQRRAEIRLFRARDHRRADQRRSRSSSICGSSS